MLTISVGREGSDTYFSKDNYYTKEEGIQNSYWFGNAASLLGLEEGGRVDPDVYATLWRGEVDGRRLGRVIKGEVKHCPGFDLTFSAPKSLSILSEVYGEDALRAIHDQAVQHTLKVAQDMVAARITSNGQAIQLNTHNALFACFTHDVNRNLDPNLHTHAFLLNMTYTQNGWRSIDMRRILDSQKRFELGKEYRSRLAMLLKEAGYSFRKHRDPHLFEIAGVPESLIRAFSSRSEEIEQWFRDRGLEYDSELAKTVSLITRKKKVHLSDSEKQAVWQRVAAPFDFDPQTLRGTPSALPTDSEQTQRVRGAMKRALSHLSERDMGFTLEQLGNETMAFGLGEFADSVVRREIERLKQNGRLLRSRDHSDPDQNAEFWTTPEQKTLESAIVSLMHAEQGGHNVLVKEVNAAKGLEKTRLNEQQKPAILQALVTQDRYYALQGDPGVGKTTALREYRKQLNKAGYDVLGMAPSYQAVEELSNSLNIQGMTVDRYIADPRSAASKKPFRKQVWIVDETSMLSSDRLYQLMRLAQERDARILFAGDHQQLEAVGSGRGFLQLQAAGIGKAVLNKWMRPKTELMEDLFRHTMNKRYGRMLTALRTHGRLYLEKDEARQIERIGLDWLDLDKQGRKDTIIIAPTNEQCRELNHFIRQELKQEGTVTGAEQRFESFNDVHFTNEQVRFAGAYQPGMVVRFAQKHNKVEGGRIQAQEYFQVVGVSRERNRLALQSMASKRVVYVDPAQVGGNRSGGIQVYEHDNTSLAKGDRIRWLNNKNDHGLRRNTELTVLAVSKHSFKVAKADGSKITLSMNDYRNRHFTHDYAKTAYGVQGATYTRALALLTSWRRNTTHQRSTMVALTRATHDAAIYTDNESALRKALERTGDNTEALTQPEFQQTIEHSKQQRTSRALI